MDNRLQELLDYYKNLLIIQYNSKDKAKRTIEAVVNAILPGTLPLDVLDSFDLDTAVGEQLDVIGKYVGINRFFADSTLTGVFFGFSDETSFEPVDVEGFAEDTDFLTKTGEFIGDENLLSFTNSLNDNDYRTLIQLKIVQNNINHSNASIDSGLAGFFSGNIFHVDSLDMTMVYFLPSDETALLMAILDKDVLPRPMGVKIKNIISTNTYFALGDKSGLFSTFEEGFSDKTDFFTKTGEILAREDIMGGM